MNSFSFEITLFTSWVARPLRFSATHRSPRIHPPSHFCRVQTAMTFDPSRIVYNLSKHLGFQRLSPSPKFWRISSSIDDWCESIFGDGDDEPLGLGTASGFVEAHEFCIIVMNFVGNGGNRSCTGLLRVIIVQAQLTERAVHLIYTRRVSLCLSLSLSRCVFFGCALRESKALSLEVFSRYVGTKILPVLE